MAIDEGGWAEGVTAKPTKNFYQRPNPREIIVMHYTAGYAAKSAINTFLDRKSSASAHFVVDLDGSVTQMVSLNHCAWHAGGGHYDGRPRVNEFSIGIEIVNPGYHFARPDGVLVNWKRTPVPPAKLAPFPGMMEAYDPWVGSTALWPHFPDDQLDAVEALTNVLIDAYPSISDIVGHRDVDGVRRLKVDPGPAFPMRRVKMLLDRRSDTDGEPVNMLVDTAGGSLNVRGGPGIHFERLGWGPLHEGDAVLRLERQGDWYLVRQKANGGSNEGWVYARYLRKAREP